MTSQSKGAAGGCQPVIRHRTAIRRGQLSRPIRLALADGLIAEGKAVFDYGCGHGEDLRLLQKHGIKCSGWDPAFRPKEKKAPADVVNLGYVVNVIEDPDERAEVLRDAWRLASTALVVSARSAMELSGEVEKCQLGDGFLSSRSTFQKYFSQADLRAFIDSTLSVRSLPAAPGVFYVFRHDEDRERFLASRYRRRRGRRPTRTQVLFEENREILEALMDFVTDRGRLPQTWELPESETLAEVFGSLRRAFLVVRRATGEDEWRQVEDERRMDLLVYLALARLDGGRCRFSELPEELQLDVRSLLSSYRKACQLADELLFSAGNRERVAAECQSSPVGKLTPAALYVHESARGELPSIVRIVEGCARSYLGAVDGANLVKIYRRRPQVSYLAYPEFDSDPHPALYASLTLRLDTLSVRYIRYADSANPPVLHRKELLVDSSYPLRERFERLTKQEDRHGLFDCNASRIGKRATWEAWVAERGYRLRGHRVCKALSTDRL